MPRSDIRKKILDLIPHRSPFRFVDEILHVDENGAKGRYTFRKNEGFYAGHFPQFAITPGVILLEAMNQMGVIPLGIYLISLEVTWPEVSKYVMAFTDAQVEFFRPVFPGETVICESEKVFWRLKKLRAKTRLLTENGQLIAEAFSAGVAFSQDSYDIDRK